MCLLVRPFQRGRILYRWTILRMFSLTKKIALAASLLVFCSGQLLASDIEGSALENGKRKSTEMVAITGVPDPGFQDRLPNGVMQMFLAKASKGTNPRHLASVCRHWYDIMREDKLPEETLKYSAMNPFMQECMRIYWEQRFYNGALIFRPNIESDEGMIKLNVSALANPYCGTFDLTQCVNQENDRTSDFLVITTDEDQFFKVRAENTDKVVILIALRHLLEQKIYSKVKHPFTRLLAGWDADKAPVGIFWRWGIDADLTLVDYLTTASLKNVSSKNLYENWKKTAGGRYGGLVQKGLECAEFSCLFVNQK